MNEHQRDIGTVIKSFLGDVHERYKVGGVDLLGRSTGFGAIDERTGGIQDQELWIVGSRQGMGKTSFILGMAEAMDQSHKKTLLFSLEMPGEMLVNRMVSAKSGVPAGAIIRGKMEPEQWLRVGQAAKELMQHNIQIIDVSVTSEKLIEMVCETPNVGLTIVDYAGILSDPSTNGQTERMGEISRNMKLLTSPDYSSAPVVLVTQLNRASELNDQSRPLLSNIKDSDAFGADASVVLFPFRPYYFDLMKGAPMKDVEDAEIIIAKNRNGPVGTTSAKFYPKQMMWEQKGKK